MQSKNRGMGVMGAVAPIQDLLLQAAAKYSIPPSILLAQAQEESSFNQSAISSKGAIGVMQLMPATAGDLGVDPYNLEQNIDGGARYLKQQYNRFGSWDMALAAYNAGGGAVHKAGGYAGIPEAANYVQKIFGYQPQYLSYDTPGGIAPTLAVDTGGGAAPTDVAQILDQGTPGDQPGGAGSGGPEAGVISIGTMAVFGIVGLAIALAFRR